MNANERKAFEAWAKSRNFNVESFKSKDGKEEYCWPYINGAWAAWQARGAQQEPVAWIAPHRLKGLQTGIPQTVYMKATNSDTVPLYTSPPAQPDAADELDRLTTELAALKAGNEQALFSAAKELERMDAELAAAKKENEWQPIETAPKDGSYVLVTSGGKPWIARFHPVYQSGYRPQDPWQSMMLNHLHIEAKYQINTPTHWKPLPAPPDAAKGSDNQGEAK